MSVRRRKGRRKPPVLRLVLTGAHHAPARRDINHKPELRPVKTAAQADEVSALELQRRDFMRVRTGSWY